MKQILKISILVLALLALLLAPAFAQQQKGFYFAAQATYPAGVSVAAGYNVSERNTVALRNTVATGQLKLLCVEHNFVLLSNRFQPYTVAAVVLFNRTATASAVKRKDVSNTIAFEPGAGFKLYVSNKLALNFSARWSVCATATNYAAPFQIYLGLSK